MKVHLIGLLTETSMHPGTESSTGVVDLPIAREISTDYPVIAGSSLKGAFRESYEAKKGEELANRIFGQQDRVGDVAIADARILLLPVRTLTGHYKWVTCPYILDRFFRDLKLAGNSIRDIEIPKIEEGKALYYGSHEEIFLEEIVFTLQVKGEILQRIVEMIKPLLYHRSLKDRLLNQLVIINDDEFAYYARYGLEVRARNKLDSETKTSLNLWYEECIPPDTLFYTLFLCRTGKETSLAQLKDTFVENPYIQIGGNESIGQGWCVLNPWEEGEDR
jgi:CRISPR-associated protein Cmr4